MSDNIAILDGYTEPYMAYSSNGAYDIFILVKPDTDFDSCFKAWDSDAQKYISILGWLWDCEPVTEDN